jgi:hypothetical protein
MNPLRRWMYPAFGVMVGILFAGCAGMSAGRTTAAVILMKNGAAGPLNRSDYAALKGQIKVMLAEHQLEMVESLRDAKMLATVEIQMIPGEGVAVVGVREVKKNPAWIPAFKEVASYPSERSSDNKPHPSFDLARTLDHVK